MRSEGPVRLWNRMIEEKGQPVEERMPNGVAAYRERYNAGYRYSMRGSSLDAADDRGLTDCEAWMDGYLDAAVGREQYHMAFCPNHEECP